MIDMRRLSSLYVNYLVVSNNQPTNPTAHEPLSSALDMFHRKNYDKLEDAFVRYTTRERNDDKGDLTEKSGLMMSTYYVLM